MSCRAIRGAVCLGAMLLPLWALAQTEPPAWSYRVVKGDNLYTVTRDYLAPGVSWQRLQRLNRVADPRRLTPGRELRVPVGWLRAEAAVATVAFIVGRAQRETGGAVPVALAAGDTLRPGDVLLTDDDANVTLRLADASRVLVSGGSRVKMESLLAFGRSGVISSRLGVERGEVDSRINPGRAAGTRYDVRTPVLTLGVRGTEFRVRVADGDAAATTTEVTEGRVAAARSSASSPSSVSSATRAPVAEKPIDAGFGMVAAAGTAASGSAGLSPVQPLPAAPWLGTLPVLYEHVPLRFSWPQLDGAVAYRAQVFADDSLNQRLLDGVFDRPSAQWIDLPDGRYLLQVRARNAQGLEGRDGRLAFTLKARPEPPFTALPRDDGRAYGDKVDFSWTAATAAQRYRLQVSTDTRFDAPLIDRSDLDSPRVTLPLPLGRYHWRVASIAQGDDLGPFSDTVAFELREVPPPPPVDAPKVQGDKMVFRWRERSGDDAYDVQVARDAAFTQLVVERREKLPELLLDKPAGGTYYLRVRTIEADGFVGPYGSAQQFEVPRNLWWLLLPGVGLLLLL